MRVLGDVLLFYFELKMDKPMPGRMNSNKDGVYVYTQPIIKNHHIQVGLTQALQCQMIPGLNAYFENHLIDTKGSPHRITESKPARPGAVSGTVNAPARAVIGSSDIFFINGYATNNSGTRKSQNQGNCPISPMVTPTSSHSIFYVTS